VKERLRSGGLETLAGPRASELRRQFPLCVPGRACRPIEPHLSRPNGSLLLDPPPSNPRLVDVRARGLREKCQPHHAIAVASIGLEQLEHALVRAEQLARQREAYRVEWVNVA